MPGGWKELIEISGFSGDREQLPNSTLNSPTLQARIESPHPINLKPNIVNEAWAGDVHDYGGISENDKRARGSLDPGTVLEALGIETGIRAKTLNPKPKN